MEILHNEMTWTWLNCLFPLSTPLWISISFKEELNENTFMDFPAPYKKIKAETFLIPLLTDIKSAEFAFFNLTKKWRNPSDAGRAI